MRNVYIQTADDGQIENHNLYAAFEGFSKMEYDVHLFTLLPPTQNRDDIVCGKIHTVRQAWRYMGVPLPAMLDYPAELTHYLGRHVYESTLGAVRSDLFADNPTPRFVKPKNHHKLFNGKLMFSPACLNESTMHGDEVAVWCAEPVRFLTEYRIFVYQGRIKGFKHYYGNYRVLPDFAVVDAAIAEFRNSPVSYSIDFGVTDDGRTLLIEVNDFFALGNYGLDSFVYAKLVEARWDEVTGSTFLRDHNAVPYT